MRYSTKFIKTAFFTAIAIVLAVAIMLFFGVRNLMGSYDMVNHTWEVEYKVLRLYAGVRNAESSVRGYLLTDDPRYLQERIELKKNFRQLLPNLHYLIRDNPEQIRNMKTMDSLIYRRMEIFDSTVLLYEQGATREYMRERLAIGQKVTDQLEALAAKMYGIESKLLKDREDTHDYYFRRLSIYMVMLTLLMLLLLTLIFNHLQKQIRKQQEMQVEMKATNDMLQEQKKVLEKANEELESFNYIASHDLKEPLRKIRTFAGMIQSQEEEKFSARGKHNFHRLVAAAERMQLLLDDLLAYTKLNSAKESYKEVSLEQLVAQAQDNLQELINESGIHIRTSNLPTVHGIPFQLQQLFENMIHNAIKYRRTDVVAEVQITGSITKSADLPADLGDNRKAAYHCITIQDNGIGFQQEYAPKVFDLFTRLHTDPSYTGSGVGLTICKKIVDNHDGFMDVKSAVNQGTRFRIFLPI